MHAKAHNKSSKPETLLKLDKWYQNELPKKIKSRAKEGRFLTHDEIVQTIKWKLARGQFRPRLKDLVQMNTPRVVMQETKKAFRALAKKRDLEDAAKALCNLKGVGPAMASAVLAAGAPDEAPFMADEVLLAMPDIEGIDYTMKEYMKLVEKTRECMERLNSQGGSWTPHKVELAVWTHYVLRDLKPELLDNMPGTAGAASPRVKQQTTNGDAEATTDAAEVAAVNGEDSRDSGVAEQDESNDAAAKPAESSSSSSQEEAAHETPPPAAAVEEAAPADQPKENGVVEQQPAGEKEKEPAAAAVEAAAEPAPADAAAANGDDTKAEEPTAASQEEAAGETKEAEKSKTEAVTTTAVENGVEGGEAVVNGSLETTAAAQNGVAEELPPQSNGDSTKEETVKTSCDSAKRTLEADESVQAETKRFKTADELPAAPPIPAGGE